MVCAPWCWSGWWETVTSAHEIVGRILTVFGRRFMGLKIDL